MQQSRLFAIPLSMGEFTRPELVLVASQDFAAPNLCSNDHVMLYQVVIALNSAG